MNIQMIMKLVKKDVIVARYSVASHILLAGVLGIIIYLLGNKIRPSLTVLGFFYISFYGLHMLIKNILMERSMKTASFVMGLPVSQSDYSISKILSSLILFMPFWALLAIGTLYPHTLEYGLYSPVVQVGVFFFAKILLAFCIVLAVALISENLNWVMVAAGFCVMMIATSILSERFIPEIRTFIDRDFDAAITPFELFLAGGPLLVVGGMLLLFAHYWRSKKMDFVN